MLAGCDLVLYDRLVDPAVLGLASKSARKVYVGKEAGSTGLQAKINELMVSEAKRGTSASRFRQNSGISLPGFCFTVVLGPGTRGTADRPNVAARRNSRGSPG